MREFALRLRHDVPLCWKVDKLTRIADECAAYGAHFHYEPTKRRLVIVVGEPKSLGDAPNGSHEFARGWLMSEFVSAVTRIMERATTWYEIEYDFAMERLIKETDNHIRVSAA